MELFQFRDDGVHEFGGEVDSLGVIQETSFGLFQVVSARRSIAMKNAIPCENDFSDCPEVIQVVQHNAKPLLIFGSNPVKFALSFKVTLTRKVMIQAVS